MTDLIATLLLGFIFVVIVAWGLCRSASRGDELLDENELNDGSTTPPRLPVEKMLK